MEAEKNGSHPSIAFPTIGCGQLKFPSDVSSKIIFTEVNKFTQYNTLKVRAIKIMIFRKKPS